MMKLTTQILLTMLLSLTAIVANALDAQLLPDIKAGVVTMQIQDPERAVGYTVGDVITRHVILSIKKPYKLIDESLPIIGYEKRYRGQTLGVDLSSSTHTFKDSGNTVVHDLTWTYQVFTNKNVVKRGALPTEYVNIINLNSKGKEVGKFRVPSFEFTISPIAAFGQIKIEEDISTFRGPLLLNKSVLKQRLNILLAVMGVSLLGLLYMLGKHAWLPRMGGPFAKAHRVIRKQDNTPTGIQNAVSSMHSALNTTAGLSLFNGNLEAFLAKKPAFRAIKAELGQFFGLSTQVFFEPNAAHAVGNDPIAWLGQFSRRCRDCERGLVPDHLNQSNLGLNNLNQGKV